MYTCTWLPAVSSSSAADQRFRVVQLDGSQYVDVAESQGSDYTDVVRLNRSGYTEAR
jgi:hypothetical protein